MKLFLKYWLPVLVWLAVIFIGSTDLMSAEHTSRIIAPLLRWLRPGISEVAIAQVQFFARKVAHLGEYAVLAFLVLRALRVKDTIDRRITFVGTILFAAIVAASDEYHQSFVSSRTASANDVMIDVLGATIAVIIFSAFAGRRRRENGPERT